MDIFQRYTCKSILIGWLISLFKSVSQQWQYIDWGDESLKIDYCVDK